MENSRKNSAILLKRKAFFIRNYFFFCISINLILFVRRIDVAHSEKQSCFFFCYTKKMLKNQNFVRVEIKQEYSSWKFYRTKFHET